MLEYTYNRKKRGDIYMNVNINIHINIIKFKRKLHFEYNWNRDVYSKEEFHATFITNETKIKAVVYVNEKNDGFIIKDLLLIDELKKYESFDLDIHTHRLKEYEKIKQNKAILVDILWKQKGHEVIK
jgi:hypothetical protein